MESTHQAMYEHINGHADNPSILFEQTRNAINTYMSYLSAAYKEVSESEAFRSFQEMRKTISQVYSNLGSPPLKTLGDLLWLYQEIVSSPYYQDLMNNKQKTPNVVDAGVIDARIGIECSIEADAVKLSKRDPCAVVQAVESTLKTISSCVQNQETLELAASASPIIEHGKRNRLSLDQVLSLFSILFAIFTFMISQLPDKQLERIIEQNTAIIAQLDDIEETLSESVEVHNQLVENNLSEEQEKTTDALTSIQTSLDLLCEEIDLLREEKQQSEDPSAVSVDNPAPVG